MAADMDSALRTGLQLVDQKDFVHGDHSTLEVEDNILLQAAAFLAGRMDVR